MTGTLVSVKMPKLSSWETLAKNKIKELKSTKEANKKLRQCLSRVLKQCGGDEDEQLKSPMGQCIYQVLKETNLWVI